MKPLTRKQPLSSTNNILEVQKEQNGSNRTNNGTILGSKAKKMRRYRANLKSDPERLEKARKKDRERKRAARANLKHEIKRGYTELQKKVRTQTRQHMQRYRNKLTAKMEKNKIRNPLHEYMIEKSQQEKKAAKERTQRWRMKIKLSKNNPVSTCTDRENSNTVETEKSECPSRWAVYRSTKKVKKALPKTPVKKAAVLKKLLQSPNTAKCLADEGILRTEESKKKVTMADSLIQNIADQIDEVKPAGTQQKGKKSAYDTLVKTALKSISKKYVYKSQNLLRTLGINWKNTKKFKKAAKNDWWKQNPRKARKDRISEQTKLKVINFYLSPEVSREVPNKKEVILVKENNQKEYVQKHVMLATSADAFSQYKSEYPEDKIGFTSFKKLKPKNMSEESQKQTENHACVKLVAMLL